MLRSLFFFLLIIPFTSLAQSSSDEALALQFFQSGEYEKALPLYKELHEKSQGLNFYDQYFTILLRVKKYDEAEALVKKLLKRIPQNPTFQIDYGRVLQEKGQPEEAKEWYAQLIQKMPANEFSIRELANTFYRAEAYDFSVKTLLAGREVLKDDNAFTFELISLYRFQKNKEQLVRELLKELNRKPEIQNQARNMLSSIFDSNEDYEVLKKILLTQLQKNAQNVAYADLLSWLYLQQNQYSLALKQAISLHKRLNEGGERIYELAITFIVNKAYREAVDALNYIVSLGRDNSYYIPSRIQLLNTKFQLLTSGSYSGTQLTEFEKQYQDLIAEFGKNNQTVFALRQLATLKGFYLKKPGEATALMEDLLDIPGLPPSVVGQAKLELGDLYILNNELWEATLIYGQVEKELADHPLGQEAKFRSAKLSYYRGDFEWAKAQLDVLKGATSQLIANDALNLSLLIAQNTSSAADSGALKIYAEAELMLFKKQYDLALNALDSITVKYPTNSLADDILMSRARIYLEQHKYHDAQLQLETIIGNHAYDLWADDALFMLAELNETQLNNQAKARELYQKIITDFPGSLFVNDARKRYRILRGDTVD